ncbi:unnamed protein product [Paramecium octaurelia]|uniref:Uncharacterized protein n=1 Tax=Paramecium octaurelia TaxID=43137 RepID=A0A8S1YFJ9_PAROT|nr:unnamed protein product [Paramecium octaurelia]
MLIQESLNVEIKNKSMNLMSNIMLTNIPKRQVGKLKKGNILVFMYKTLNISIAANFDIKVIHKEVQIICQHYIPI